VSEVGPWIDVRKKSPKFINFANGLSIEHKPARMARTRSQRQRTITPQGQRRSFAAIGVVTTLSLVALVALLGPVYRPGRVVPIADAPADITPAVSPATEAAAASLAERPVYPYSIVAGGTASVDELKRAIDADPVVAGHYSNFDLTKTRVEKLTKPQVAFVSYRMGNDIYWTRKPLVIRAGEKVLTDGVNIARTRCANQLSALPGPTSEFEPPAVTLETPALGPLPTPPIATLLPPGGGWLGVPPFGTHPTPTGIPIPPGVTFTAPPTGTPSHTDTPEQTPPDETPQDPPLPPQDTPLPPQDPPLLRPPGPPPLPPITIDDPILPPPSIGLRNFDPPGDPEDPTDPEGSEDPPKAPPISVPEPATSVLLLIAGGACAIGRKLTTRAHD
jgi:hypothetical protein